MRRAALVVVVMAFARTAMAEDLDSPVATTSRWDLTFAAGVSSASPATTTMPGMQLMPSVQARTVTTDMTADTTIEPSGLFALRYRIRDRVLWSIPTLSFAYLGGEAGEREWIPWAGLTSWGAGYSSIAHLIAQGELGAGAGVREWLAPGTTVNITAGVASQFLYTSSPPCAIGSTMCPGNWEAPQSWRATVTAGASYDVGNTWKLNLAIGGSQRLLAEGSFPRDSAERGTIVAFGSIQTIGLRVLPLIEARVNARWSVDGYASAAYDLSRSRFEQTYLVGVTRLWSK